MHTMRTLLAFGVLIALLLIAASVYGMPLLQIPPVPHPVDDAEDCLACHGSAAIVPYPQDHEGRDTESCTLCHQMEVVEPIPPIPHPFGDVEDCLMCHGSAATMPYPRDHEGRDTESCTLCHQTGVVEPIPPVPHPPEYAEDCLACHGSDPAVSFPQDHKGRGNESCTMCHRIEAVRSIPIVPHPTEEGEDCQICHATGQVKPFPSDHEGRASEGCLVCHQVGLVEAPEPSAIPPPSVQVVPTPIHEPAPSAENSCISCHKGLGGKHGQIAADWSESIHAAQGVGCANCHGGDPTQGEAIASMSLEAGFLGTLPRDRIPGLCGSCHSRVDLMQPFDLPTDQLDQYWQSRHGQALLAGDPNVATCSDCHGAHRVLSVSDPASEVHPSNEPELCAGCHADRVLMAPYDIPTNQYDLYQKSAHGEALLQERNLQAPTCSTCHGSHDAAFSGTLQTADVCGQCHAVTEDYYLQGAHRAGMAEAEAPHCLTCHANPRVDEWAEADRTAVYVDEAAYAQTLHSETACIGCHTDLARIPHLADETVACATCHATILDHVNMGAPHMSTDCATCHLEELPAIKDEATGQVMLATVDRLGMPLDRTEHNIVKEASCDKCHFSSNAVGAPAVTLPARSVLCMACHDASPTVSVALLDPTPVRTDFASIVGLLIFGVGIVFNVSLYLKGEIPGHPGITTIQKIRCIAADTVRFIFSRRISRFLGGAIADGIFLRRVLQEDVGRWVVHALIYLPFLARFGLGLITWLGMVFWPSAEWTQTLADRDSPGVAFAYDLLTALMILGVVLAIFRRFVLRDRRLLTFNQDKIAIALLGAILLVGILTEGIRLLSAGTPSDVAVYSFLGYGVAAILRPLNLTWNSIYPVIWYAHALLVAAFIAYLPFSKFMHILAGPFIASLDAARKEGH